MQKQLELRKYWEFVVICCDLSLMYSRPVSVVTLGEVLVSVGAVLTTTLLSALAHFQQI